MKKNRNLVLERRSKWISKMVFLAVGVLSMWAFSMQSEPTDKFNKDNIAQQEFCQAASNKFSPITDAWRNTQDVKELENVLTFCETLRQARLANPQCREVYLRAIQLILDAPSEGDLNRAMAIVKIQKTATRMLIGDDLNQLPAAEREAHRAEVMRKNVLFARQLRDQSASSEKEKPFYLNVSPPSNPGQPAIAGQSPDAIKDPVKRQKYLDDRKANQNRKDSEEKRERLGAALNDQTRQIERYILRHYPATPDSEKEVQSFLELGGFDKQQIQTLLNKISARENAQK